MNIDLAGKVALITGASRGIGAATAKTLAQAGCTVVINYHISAIEPDAAQNALNVQTDILDHDGKADVIAADVTVEEDVVRMIESVRTTYERLDILVNNAGIVFDLEWNHKTVAQWQQTLNTNLIAAYLTTKYASDLLSENKGRIINISSTNADKAHSPFSLDYDASKAGLISLTKNLAQSLAPNVLVNAIAPGWVDTEMNKDLDREVVREETEKIWLKRFAEPQEIADVVLFLASDMARYVNGSVVTVDGGY